METFTLSPSVLEWAASQVGCTLGELASKVSKSQSRAEQIVGGRLTSPQVRKFADVARVPVGYLFLEAPPPPRELPVADFRTLPESRPLSRDFYDTLDDITYKQDWYESYLESIGAEPLPFIGSYSRKRPTITDAAAEITATLGLSIQEARTLRSPDAYFSYLAAKCEQIGILVFKNGVVGSNTHRPLSVDEFRGFALAHPLAPAIFINGADAPAAWVFTLAHEVTHLWLGESGVSDASPIAQNKVERYCNAVAAETLVPDWLFVSRWQELKGEPIDALLERLSRELKVSRLVIARKALEQGITDAATYQQTYRNLIERKKTRGGGGNFYNSLATRNSKTLTNRVVGLAMSGAITLGQAGRLLNTNPNNIVKFHAKRSAIPF